MIAGRNTNAVTKHKETKPRIVTSAPLALQKKRVAFDGLKMR